MRPNQRMNAFGIAVFIVLFCSRGGVVWAQNDAEIPTAAGSAMLQYTAKMRKAFLWAKRLTEERVEVCDTILHALWSRDSPLDLTDRGSFEAMRHMYVSDKVVKGLSFCLKTLEDSDPRRQVLTQRSSVFLGYDASVTTFDDIRTVTFIPGSGTFDAEQALTSLNPLPILEEPSTSSKESPPKCADLPQADILIQFSPPPKVIDPQQATLNELTRAWMLHDRQALLDSAVEDAVFCREYTLLAPFYWKVLANEDHYATFLNLAHSYADLVQSKILSDLKPFVESSPAARQTYHFAEIDRALSPLASLGNMPIGTAVPARFAKLVKRNLRTAQMYILKSTRLYDYALTLLEDPKATSIVADLGSASVQVPYSSIEEILQEAESTPPQLNPNLLSSEIKSHAAEGEEKPSKSPELEKQISDIAYFGGQYRGLRRFWSSHIESTAQRACLQTIGWFVSVWPESLKSPAAPLFTTGLLLPTFLDYIDECQSHKTGNYKRLSNHVRAAVLSSATVEALIDQSESVREAYADIANDVQPLENLDEYVGPLIGDNDCGGTVRRIRSMLSAATEREPNRVEKYNALTIATESFLAVMQPDDALSCAHAKAFAVWLNHFRTCSNRYSSEEATLLAILGTNIAAGAHIQKRIESLDVKQTSASLQEYAVKFQLSLSEDLVSMWNEIIEVATTAEFSSKVRQREDELLAHSLGYTLNAARIFITLQTDQKKWWNLSGSDQISVLLEESLSKPLAQCPAPSQFIEAAVEVTEAMDNRAAAPSDSEQSEAPSVIKEMTDQRHEYEAKQWYQLKPLEQRELKFQTYYNPDQKSRVYEVSDGGEWQPIPVGNVVSIKLEL